MVDNMKSETTVSFRLVLIEPIPMRIMTIHSDSGPVLPTESIVLHSRTAEALTQKIEETFGLRTIQLALLPAPGSQDCCSVHEILPSRSTLPSNMSLATLSEISPHQLTPGETVLISKLMRGEETKLGRFARIGWIDELMLMTRCYGQTTSIPAVRQINQGVNFSLIKLSYEDGDRVWFKAVGEPNTHEYALTLELSRHFPTYLPKLLGSFPQWQGWVAEDVAGQPLSDLDEVRAWESALEALATLQKSAIERVADLRRAGAKEWGCDRLASLAGPFFEDVQRAMLAQVSTKVRPLGGDELRSLKERIEVALIALMGSGMPNTLLHGDIGHGNIIIAPNRIVFLDWAEAYIGHPFMSAEHLLANCELSQPAVSQKVTSLRQTYASYWEDVISPEELAKTTRLAPAVAAFGYAVTTWANAIHGPSPNDIWPTIRSMVRRIKRELDSVLEVAA